MRRKNDKTLKVLTFLTFWTAINVSQGTLVEWKSDEGANSDVLFIC